MIKVNMAKAREIKKQMIREDREPLLKALDIEFMRAVEINDVNLQAQISAKKQALRDAPQDPLIETAQTPEELKDLVPTAFTL
jgi:hypothetical protein